MSVLASMYNISFDVKRGTVSTSTATNALTTISSSNLGVKRPVTEKADLFNESQMGKEFKLHCDEDIDVRVGDVITIGSTSYGVAAVTEFEDLEDDTESHLEIRIYQRNA